MRRCQQISVLRGFVVLILLAIVPGLTANDRLPPPGQSVDVELSSTEPHIFDIELAGGQFLAVRAAAAGGIVQITLLAPGGTTLEDRSGASKRPVRIATIATASGVHHLIFKTR